jgi:hypothetical protein
MFQYLDIVIGFVVLMLVASLFITAATQVVVSLLGLRGANLRRSLVDLFETACPGQEAKPWAKEVARRVLRHPTISDSIFSRFALRVDQVPFAPPETAGKLQGISGAIPLLPWIMGAIGGAFVTAIAMAVAKHWFADTCQYANHLAGYVSVLNFCQHPWRTGAILGAILGGLLSRWRLATSIHAEELPAILEQLAAPLPGTLPDPAQRAMLILAWTRYEPGASPRLGAGAAASQEVGPVRSKAYFDESLVRRASAAALVHGEHHSAAEDFDEGIVRHAGPLETEASVAVATESATAPAKELEPETTPGTRVLTPVSTPSEPRLEGLRAWFDHVMERASQRFTVQTRLITVVLSCVFVFAWHFDAVQLLQSMSRGAELRAQLTAAAAGIDKQAEQLPRSKQGAHTVVPEVYRQAMVSVLRTASTETSANNEGTQGKSSAKRRGRAKEREKDAATAAPGVDRVTAEAKSKAMHDLETVPGFASREEAESWLRTTLDGNPARAILAVAYRQEVNAELVNDSDRFIDQSASLTSELGRSEIKLFQDERPSPLSRTEVPGLLVTIAFLSLGAAFWYNTLKNLASLRPQVAIRQAGEHKL